VELRKAVEGDVPAILAVLDEPAVAEWWGENTAQDVRDELGVSSVVVIDGEIVGLLLVHEETEPDYRHVAYDIAIATRFHGTGLGRRVLRSAIRDAIATRFHGTGLGRRVLRSAIRDAIAAGHHRFQIDPRADNEVAIGSYAAVGFKPVGILRESDRGRDGVWHDALLMDLLAREFVDSD
jgi:aminoglycoside 6'-N-acetyltransferase